jgi:hypothetical protein
MRQRFVNPYEVTSFVGESPHQQVSGWCPLGLLQGVLGRCHSNLKLSDFRRKSPNISTASVLRTEGVHDPQDTF